MQASTHFPKVRRMLLCFSPLILQHFWPASTLLHGHLALATLSLPETDPQILEHWRYADEVFLGKSIQTKDFCLECMRHVQLLSCILHVGSVSVCLSSSVKSMKTSAAPYPSIVWLMFLQHGHCTFVTILFTCQHSHCNFATILNRFLAGPFVNLAMRVRALFPKSATTLGLVKQAFWWVSLFTE